MQRAEESLTVGTMSQKGARLEGGNATDEALASSRAILAPGRNGQARGTQQFFTPKAVSSWIASIVGTDALAFDPTAGNGALLSGFNASTRYGVELDSDQVAEGSKAGQRYRAWSADIQHMFPLLSRVEARFPVVVANPPFGLSWDVTGLGKGSSTLLGWRIARELLTPRGAGVLICGADRFDREIAPDYAAHFVARVDVARLFGNVDLACTIAFYVRDPSTQGPEVFSVDTPADLTEKIAGRVNTCLMLAGFSSYLASKDACTPSVGQLCDAAHAEYKRRLGDRLALQRDTVEVRGAKLSSKASAFAQLSLIKRPDGRQILEWLQSFDKQPVSWFALQTKEYARLLSLCADETTGITLATGARTAIEQAIAAGRRDAMPLYPVPMVQRLGFLADLDSIRCTVADPARGFEAGVSYGIACVTDVLGIHSQRMRTNSKGEEVIDDVRTEKKETLITITGAATLPPAESALRTKSNAYGGICERCREYVHPGAGEAYLTVNEGEWKTRHSEGVCKPRGTEHQFSGVNADDLTYLMEHFEIPDPGDIASRYPAESKHWRSILDKIGADIQARESTFSFRWFQSEDIARLGFKGRGLLGWEQGAGKALGLMSWVRALTIGGKLPDGCALFVMPQDLIPQFKIEAARFFGVDLLHVDRVADTAGGERRGKQLTYSAVSVDRMVRDRRADLKAQRTGVHLAPRPPVWAITHFEALSARGNQWEERGIVNVRRTREVIPATEPRECWQDGEYVTIPGEPERVNHGILTSAEVCPECGATPADGWDGYACKGKRLDAAERKALALDKGTKGSGRRVRGCGYVHASVNAKSGYSVLARTFRAVCIDEATKIKGDGSAISKAVRAFQVPYRIAASGTPLKNYVADLFWLLWWTLGDSTARFPYSYRGGQERFEKDFGVFEYVMHGRRKGPGKPLPEVSNLLRLWRTLCGALVRRRIDEIGATVQMDGQWTCPVCLTGHQSGPWTDTKPDKVHCGPCDREWDTVAPVVYQPTAAPWGKAQKEFYSRWLSKHTFAAFFKQTHPETRIPDGMIPVMAAMLGQVAKLDYACTDPMGDPDDHVRSQVPDLSPWTPSRLRMLELCLEHVRAGRKVLVGSSHKAVGPWIAARLCEAGIKAIHITDEDSKGKVQTKSAMARARVIQRFKTGDAQVLCVGTAAVSMGHNLDCASVAIVEGLPWDFATFDQFVKRVRRLTSKRPVTVIPVFQPGSLASRKWELLTLKTKSADLALDGRIVKQATEQIDMAALLAELQEKGIQADGSDVAENQCAARWEAIKDGAIPVDPSADLNTGAPVAKPSRRRAPKPEAAEEGPRKVRTPAPIVAVQITPADTSDGFQRFAQGMESAIAEVRGETKPTPNVAIVPATAPDAPVRRVKIVTDGTLDDYLYTGSPDAGLRDALALTCPTWPTERPALPPEPEDPDAVVLAELEAETAERMALLALGCTVDRAPQEPDAPEVTEPVTERFEPDPDWYRVDSTNLDAIAYDPTGAVLSVRFKSGTVYAYDNVTPVMHAELMCAPSHGEWFAANIRRHPDRHPFRKVQDGGRDAEPTPWTCPECGKGASGHYWQGNTRDGLTRKCPTPPDGPGTPAPESSADELRALIRAEQLKQLEVLRRENERLKRKYPHRAQALAA